jgi:glucokinase
VVSNVVGIDVGGTTVKGARVTLADRAVVASSAVATPQTSDALTAAVVSLAQSLRDQDTAAVGVTSPGFVRGDVVRYSANLPWRDEPVRSRVASALGLPVALLHDTLAAALAEADRAGHTDMLFVGIGTGIAGVHVRNGVAHRGATGQAGEIGHTPVRRVGDVCSCGQRGCLETYASAAAIARRYAARTGRTVGTDVIAASVDSDADAAAVWQEAIDALALALTTDVLVADPGVIVLGGGLAAAGDTLLAPLREALAARLSFRAPPPVSATLVGPAAGMLGAARTAAALIAQET